MEMTWDMEFICYLQMDVKIMHYFNNSNIAQFLQLNQQQQYRNIVWIGKFSQHYLCQIQ